MKRFIFLASAIIFAGASVGWGATGAAKGSNPSLEATFVSLNGKVTIKNKRGVSRTAKTTSTVPEGSTVITSKDGEASLKIFDGSTVKLKPSTSLVVTTLQQPSLGEKIIKFKLKFGEFFAKVAKLTSSNSSFETDAGGVVCGVRGTEYSMFYDPQTGKVNVVVLDGTVWTTSDGKTFIYHGGQGGSFTNGQPDPTGAGNPGNGGPQGFTGTNPFYGFTGNGTDDFNNLLTDLGSGTGDAAGVVGNDGGVAGLGGYLKHSLNLQLNFPQYPPDPPTVPIGPAPSVR